MNVTNMNAVTYTHECDIYECCDIYNVTYTRVTYIVSHCVIYVRLLFSLVLASDRAALFQGTLPGGPGFVLHPPFLGRGCRGGGIDCAVPNPKP